MPARILQGDCLDLLPTLPDNSIDAIVTDPPYHLASAQAMSVKFNHKRNGDGSDRTHQPNYAKRGFMNSEWDGGDIAFRTEVWEQCLRVLKPGGYMVAFGSTRTHHRLWCAIEDAGFEVRDTLMWVRGQGFPKSHNLGDGWGTALKPAYEPIVLARKPMSEKTVAANVLKHGVGGLNIDGCRVSGTKPQVTRGASTFMAQHDGRVSDDPSVGRWPPNLLHDGSDEVVECFPQTSTHAKTKTGYSEMHSCFGNKTDGGHLYGSDEGSAARFFPALGYTEEERRIMYCSKASRQDRAGSVHPTIKPIKLLEWLCKLICPPGGTILDPFAGSGTTGAAASNLGFNSILIEKEAEYVEDCKRRLALFLEAHPAE